MKTILIIGVFHGDEPQGEFFIEEFLRAQDASGETNAKNKLVFIPRLNLANTRKNPNGVDLNRNFPTKNWELCDAKDDFYGGPKAASEAETCRVIDLIEMHNPDAVITIHAPYKIINFDPDNAPTRELATKVGEILGYPVQADIGYPTPGSFGTYCGIERGIPTITVEIDEEIETRELLPKFIKLFEYLQDW